MRLSLATRQPLLLMYEYDITLQTSASIASNEIAFEYDIALQTNTFIASDEHVLCWKRTLLVLEINTSVLETNV